MNGISTSSARAERAGKHSSGVASEAEAEAEAPAAAADGEDAAPPPLPAGWAATWDGQQGCVYYYNESSGETSWARPT